MNVEDRLAPWIRELAKALVAANADRGRTFDNSPDVEETAQIIAAHVPQPTERKEISIWPNSYAASNLDSVPNPPCRKTQLLNRWRDEEDFLSVAEMAELINLLSAEPAPPRASDVPQPTSHPEVVGAKPLCLDCHSAGITNCSHFDNCGGRWVYVPQPTAVNCSTCKAHEEAGVRCAECGRRIGPIEPSPPTGKEIK